VGIGRATGQVGQHAQHQGLPVKTRTILKLLQNAAFLCEDHALDPSSCLCGRSCSRSMLGGCRWACEGCLQFRSGQVCCLSGLLWNRAVIQPFFVTCRVAAYNKNGYTWPPADLKPNTAAYRHTILKREQDLAQIQDSQQKWDGWLNLAKQVKFEYVRRKEPCVCSVLISPLSCLLRVST
jgi:hypothetical protein